MADFCKQCSLDTFGEDFRELASPELPEGGRLHAICEGCGVTVLDREGVCVGKCLQHHGMEAVLTLKGLLGVS